MDFNKLWKITTNSENLSVISFVILNIAASLILFGLSSQTQSQSQPYAKLALVLVIAVAYLNLYINAKTKTPTLKNMFSAMHCPQCNHLMYAHTACDNCGYIAHQSPLPQPLPPSLSQTPQTYKAPQAPQAPQLSLQLQEHEEPIQRQHPIQHSRRLNMTRQKNNARLNNYHLQRERVFQEFGDPALHDTSVFQPSLGFMYQDIGKRDISHMLTPRQNNHHFPSTAAAPRSHELQYSESIFKK